MIPTEDPEEIDLLSDQASLGNMLPSWAMIYLRVESSPELERVWISSANQMMMIYTTNYS